MNGKQKQNTFYFHDYETFGKSPSLDRPAQFAGIRTDADLNPIEQPLICYCAPADDYLPDPEAVMITGITPQQALAKGSNEAEFARQIHHAFSQPGTCIVGYNNIRFDDEVSRNIFYRCFYDPYAYSWQHGNSRWDLLDVMRACYALRPEGINWPENEQGLPSFRLEHLTQANNLEHQQAHDAMSDVYATIAIARLVRQAQPRLFNYLFEHRHKHKLAPLINIAEMTPLVHVSGMFGALRGNTSWVVPLAWHPSNKNAVIMCDLATDISPLLTLTSDELRQRLYTRRDHLSADEPAVPIKLVHLNKCPVLAPAKTLLPENAVRLGIDRQRCRDNLNLLRQHPEVREKVLALFADAEPFPALTDVDRRLYDGFFSDADKAAMQIIQQTPAQHLPALNLTFSDNRMAELLFRYRARNYPNTLDDSEQRRWLQYRQQTLTEQRVSHYLLQLEELYHRYASEPAKLEQLKALFDYAKYLLG
ncbi:exodeoxyribonuclease I [Serratia microhaemolytica]|uniref:exodeoxyribonuclease I n=1 Tax=Serratia microhaemolytica TaxID=2675110 RepID=UPI000FDDF0AE|nr:exodeoxyribonuclease I [Serratia microhaemolytica]